ncbi:hypothetical protein EOM09_03980 [bacterium]|nr:hypothetical protein [bacterium]
MNVSVGLEELMVLLDLIELENGFDDFGNLSVYGMALKFKNYCRGIYSEDAYIFYKKNSRYFLYNLEIDKKIRMMQRKFNKENKMNNIYSHLKKSF